MSNAISQFLFIISVSNVRNGSGLYPPSYKTLSVMLSKSPQSSHPSFRMAVEVIENMLQFESSLRSDAQRLLQHKYPVVCRGTP